MEEGSSLTASATILLRLRLKYISLVVCVAVVVVDDVVTADDADSKRVCKTTREIK